VVSSQGARGLQHSQQESHGSHILPIFRISDRKMPALKSGQKLPPFLPNEPVWRAKAIKPAKP
jgi:hypothetical protein